MFSGIGGFELGILHALRKAKEYEYEKKISKCETQRGVELEQATRLDCVGFSEVDKYAIQIYQKHFKEHKNYGDCKKIKWGEVEDIDLLVGGFPCQAFSIAGKRGGFDDTRGTLFFEIARCLREKQPRLFLLENVKGLLSHDKGNTFFTIIATLDELGYDCQWQVLNSKNFGVPQNRERVFIVGHLRGTRRPEVFPIGETVKRCIRTNKQNTRSERNKSDSANCIRRTPYTNDMRIRRLTPTECERLQGFPDGWTEGISDTQRYKCLGNAVTVNVVEAIMLGLLLTKGGL
jgi:DNA (cytosine-5)-methyltransferase 1